jgi:hypothetical protein
MSVEKKQSRRKEDPEKKHRRDGRTGIVSGREELAGV